MSSGSLADLADRTAMARRVLQADMFQASDGPPYVDRASAHAKVTSKAVIERTRAELSTPSPSCRGASTRHSPSSRTS